MLKWPKAMNKCSEVLVTLRFWFPSKGNFLAAAVQTLVLRNRPLVISTSHYTRITGIIKTSLARPCPCLTVQRGVTVKNRSNKLHKNVCDQLHLQYVSFKKT